MHRLLLIAAALFTVSMGVQAQHTDSLFYGDTRSLIPNPYGWGFPAGTNAYLDVAKYQRFDFYGDADTYVVGAHVYLAYKRIVGAPDTVWIVARDAAADGSPGDILDVITVTTNQLDTTGRGNIFYFHAPPKLLGLGFVADSIFIGLEWNIWDPAKSDTIALFCDPDGFGESLQRVWEMIDYNSAWTMWPWINSPDPNFEWGYDSDLWIAALINANLPSSVSNDADVPSGFRLSQNYPNPFNPSTTLEFSVPAKGVATLTVFSILGEEVATLFSGEAEPGQLYRATLNAASLPSGMYFARLEFTGQQSIRKMLLMK